MTFDVDMLFRVKVDNIAKVAEIEVAEKEKMKDKVSFFSYHIYLLEIKVRLHTISL